MFEEPSCDQLNVKTLLRHVLNNDLPSEYSNSGDLILSTFNIFALLKAF